VYANYQTSNSLKENISVRWLEQLFCIEGIKTNFKIEDKNPDIDGTFDILNNSRFEARIEVQIKTYNAKTSRSKSKFLCDTKVLYYALKNRLNCVILFVVDIENNKSYWKYLSKSYLESLNLEQIKKNATINFELNEYVDKSNVNQSISKWQNFFAIKNNGIFFEDNNVDDSIKKKEQILNLIRNFDFARLCSEDIIRIQKFIDRFNYLLDNDFYFLKRFYYPQMWKMGIAIGDFTDTSLSYALYKLPLGEIDLIIKRIDLNSSNLFDFPFSKNFLSAASDESANPIIDNSNDIVMEHINRKIVDVIENKRFLYLSPEIAIEYVFDTLKDKYSSWHIDYTTEVDLNSLNNFLETKYLSQIQMSNLPVYSRGQTNISTLYHCVKYLTNNEFNEISRLYPIDPKQKGDLYINYLYKKMQVVFSLLPDLFDAFMYYAFPSLKSKISFWNGVDLLAVNLMAYDNGETAIEIHHFKRIDSVNTKPNMIFTKNIDHSLYSKYKEEKNKELSVFEINYSYNDVEYKFICREFTHSNLNKKYSIHEELYKYLGKRFDDYLAPDFRIMWSDIGRL